ncbi:MAG: selenocysteine-specific translation elongation factor [Planctomycetaceae bacterium]|nr:selenocysteine-specific translation elongation factor [Planctomycetaceae bacterium]
MNHDDLQNPEYLILGTAGHIDHGKTSLVRALTGTNTDRLPEEQKRGITIELGFAHLSCPPFEFGIVDVPGHQRFVRTMLAGSTGVDLVLLIVAADDSINQQTREHLEILKFLDLPAGVIVLSKCDRVEPDWIELVEQDVRELVQESFLADAPIVRTSAISGLGLDELKAALRAQGKIAASARASRKVQPFRMPIDRVFSIAGHGTVVTGSVTHGRLAVGDTIQILPEWPDREFRVRQLQSHDRSVDHVVRGQRAAVNIAGVSVEEVQRGFQLVAPGELPASDCITVQMTAADHLVGGLQDHQIIRVHLATHVVLGKVRFLQVRRSNNAKSGLIGSRPEVDETPFADNAAEQVDGSSDSVLSGAGEGLPPTKKVLAPGETILAQLLLDHPVLANWGQHMVVRRPSPVETLGQAIVLDPCLPRVARPDSEDLVFVAQLASDKEEERLSAAMYFSLDGRAPGPHLQNRMAISTDKWAEVRATTLEKMVRVQDGSNEWIFHPARMTKLSHVILKFLDQQHTLQPKRWFIDVAMIERHLNFLPSAVVTALLKRLQQSHKLRRSATGIGLPDRGPNLTKNQAKLLEQLLQQFRSAGLQPPTIEQCIGLAAKNKQDVEDLLKMAAESGDLVRVDRETYLAREAFEPAWQSIRALFEQTSGLTVSQIRDHLQITRKLAVPLCEYLDACGLTKRDGDLRALGANAIRNG